MLKGPRACMLKGPRACMLKGPGACMLKGPRACMLEGPGACMLKGPTTKVYLKLCVYALILCVCVCVCALGFGGGVCTTILIGPAFIVCKRPSGDLVPIHTYICICIRLFAYV